MYACCIKALQVLVDATLLPGGYQDLESRRGMRVSSGSCPKLTYTQNSICLRALRFRNLDSPTISCQQFLIPERSFSHTTNFFLGLHLPIFKHFEDSQCLCQKAHGFTVTNYASMQKPFPTSEISLLWLYITTDCTSVAALTHFTAPAVALTGL